MIETSFGQPFGGIIQVAYVVEDLHQSMAEFAAKFNVGPWYYTCLLYTSDAADE